MRSIGIFFLLFGIIIIASPALLGVLVGGVCVVFGVWILLAWVKVNKVLDKQYSFGKYSIHFTKKPQK